MGWGGRHIREGVEEAKECIIYLSEIVKEQL